VRRDRQQNVRRAFRSFPLHELPLAQRTINPYAFYETYLSRGRIVFLPLLMLGAAAGVAGMACRAVYRVVREILHPRVDQDEDVPSDTYWAALRKIHRMRKPVFMGSLWLRARFDAEYLGLPLPSAPPGIAAIRSWRGTSISSARRGKTGSSPSRSAAGTSEGWNGLAAGSSSSAGPSTSCRNTLLERF